MTAGARVDLPATTTASDRWLTPHWILDALGPFDLDPCGAPNWPTAEEIWTVEEGIDGLMSEWRGRVWLNPPYGRFAEEWLDKLVKHGQGTALIFARTDTASFHRHVWANANAILFIKGRVTFLQPDGSKPIANAGAASCLVAYGLDDAARLATSGIDGAYIPLSEATP